MMRYIKWMLSVLLFAPIISVGQTALPENLDQSPYFNTQFMSDPAAMATVLKQDGFQSVTFQSTDGIKLSGFLLERPNAKMTVVCCCGFYPGKKEGMASFFKLIPDYCNMLIFDARGHGQSKGRFLSNIHNYGLYEYKDILGALEFVHTRNNKPIVILGICIGTLHATHAILELQKDKRANKPNIIGFVCDSGVGSIKEVAHLPINRIHDKALPNFLSNVYSSTPKEDIKKTWGYTFGKLSMIPFNCCYSLLLVTTINRTEHTTNTYKKMGNINCPVLFVHAKDDDGTPFASILKLSNCVPNKTCRWIETSSHGSNQLRHKHDYRLWLHDFMGKLISA